MDEECVFFDEFVKSKFEGFLFLKDQGCYFGEILMEYIVKRMEIKELDCCYCFVNFMYYELEGFGFWKIICRYRYN